MRNDKLETRDEHIYSFHYQTCKVLVDKQVAFGKDEILQSWIFFYIRLSLLAVSQL